MSNKDIKKKLIKLLLMGILLGLIFGLIIGESRSHVQKERTEACMELLLFNLNVTQYAADRLNITIDELMEDFVRYKVDKMFELDKNVGNFVLNIDSEEVKK